MGFHLSSFLVGSIFSGGVGLLVHEQLSHRARLSNKWPLREWAEAEFRKQVSTLRSTIQQDADASPKPTTKLAGPSDIDLTKQWNQGIEKIQDLFRS
mmetsp:Transcript_14697/g.40630  ORF Transcript_14697/g.40630 Transcript_14697/m.40630 type:complete len:97 (-) Transcript_14697:459-749(-)